MGSLLLGPNDRVTFLHRIYPEFTKGDSKSYQNRSDSHTGVIDRGNVYTRDNLIVLKGEMTCFIRLQIVNYCIILKDS